MTITLPAPSAPPGVADDGWSVRPSRFSAALERAGFGLLVVVGLLVLLAPLIVVVVTSFNVPPGISFPPTHWSLAAYSQIPHTMYSGFITSLELGAASTAIAMVLGIPAAFGLIRGKLPGSRVLEALFRSPMQLPEIVFGLSAYAFYVLLQEQLGLPLRSSFIGLLLAHVTIIAPYVLIACMARIAAVSRDPEDAAATLGASPLRVWLRVTLPMVKQALIGSALLAFLISFNNVPVSLFLSSSGSTPLPVALFTVSQVTLTTIVYSTSTLTVLFAVVVTVVLDKIAGIRTALGRG